MAEDRSAARPPPLGILLAMCASIALLPLRSALGLGEVGGYRMFTRLHPLRLSLEAEAEGRIEAVGADELSPHLGPDARRIVVAALQGRGLGDTAESSLTESLPALAALACALDAQRTEVRVVLEVSGEHRVVSRSCR